MKKSFLFVAALLSACSVEVYPVHFVAQNDETCQKAEEAFDDVADFYAESVDLVWNGCEVQEDLPDSVSFSTLDNGKLYIGDFQANSANEIVIHVIPQIEFDGEPYIGLSSKRVAGMWKKGCGAVTLVNEPNFDVTIHEIGHHFGLYHEKSESNFMHSDENDGEWTSKQMNKVSRVSKNLIEKCE